MTFMKKTGQCAGAALFAALLLLPAVAQARDDGGFGGTYFSGQSPQGFNDPGTEAVETAADGSDLNTLAPAAGGEDTPALPAKTRAEDAAPADAIVPENENGKTQDVPPGTP